MIAINKDLINSMEQKISDAKKDTKKQKVYKWLAITGGVVLSGYLGYKYVTK